MKQLFAALALTALLAAPAAASNWNVAATGNFSAPATWTLISGTDVNADGLPDAGDNVTIPTGMKLWMNQSTDLGNVVVTGDMCGALNSVTPIAYVHKMNSLTVSGNLELADGRAQGTVTYDVNNLTVNPAGGLFCAIFAAPTKAEQTIPILKIGTNFTMSSSRAFPIYPLNFGGFYAITQLEFSGAGAATVNITIPATVEFGKITVPAGKSVSFSGAGGALLVDKDLLTDAPNPLLVKTGGEALFEQSTLATAIYPYGPGYMETEANAIIGTSHPEGFAVGFQKFTGLSGAAPVINANTIFKFTGAQNQVLGVLVGASVYKVILDKTGGSVNMEKDLTVAKLDLLNGTINTGAFTITGPNTLADLTQTNGTIVGNWVKPWLANVANWDKY